MENQESINSSNYKSVSRIHQVIEGFSDKIGKLFDRKPEILKKRNLDKCEKNNRVKVVESKSGKQYLKITIHPGDKQDEYLTERAEIQAKRKLEYDKRYEQSFSFQLPKNFLLDNPRIVIGQWKRSPEITNDDAPLLSQRIKEKDGKYYLVFTDGNRDEIGKCIPIEDMLGKRVDMKYEIKFSDKGESNIAITANYGGKEVEIYKGVLNIQHPENKTLNSEREKSMQNKVQAYFKFGIYRDYKENNQKTSILFKNHKMKESNK